ncbi:hypothetical protein F2P81_022842 [Scophthalmus maximus]|uniref:Secreted protein n=1 Tax=Scophthalmus maximus TaxID=52904 RepID=A0A6A4S454_SCOMX|nr:hypothetical protein F2P81_022842 [Scophthalmus maximus]
MCLSRSDAGSIIHLHLHLLLLLLLRASVNQQLLRFPLHFAALRMLKCRFPRLLRQRTDPDRFSVSPDDPVETCSDQRISLEPDFHLDFHTSFLSQDWFSSL